MENGETAENVIEIRTMSEEEAVFGWAADYKITNDAVEKLIKEGFCSSKQLSC